MAFLMSSYRRRRAKNSEGGNTRETFLQLIWQWCLNNETAQQYEMDEKNELELGAKCKNSTKKAVIFREKL